MMNVNKFKYTEAKKLSDCVVYDNHIEATVCFLNKNKPLSLALFAGSVPISYIKAFSDPVISASIADGQSYSRIILTGIREAYGLHDRPTIQCALSGNKLFQLPLIQEENTTEIKVNNENNQISILDLVLELDQGRLSNIEDILPYAINFYNEKGKNSFIESVYQMFLKRHPEPNVYQSTNFDENNISRSLLDFIIQTYESEEARRFYIRRIPGPNSDDFLFRL